MTTTGVDAPLFRQLLGRFATGVTVLTTHAPDGSPVGMTASSIAAVSLAPPLLLVSVDRKNAMHDALLTARHFIVNVLGTEQEALSRRFAGPEENRFEELGFRSSPQGVPILDGVVAHIECEKRHMVPAGDHTVFFGLVTGGVMTEGRPLLYYRGGYVDLGDG